MTRAFRDPVLIAIVLFAAIYAGFANQYYLFLLTTGALTVIVGVGLNVLIGLTGQVSFGHVGFYALGAYATAILTTKYGWNFWWTLPVALALAGVVGALLGLVALRVRGPYLAMVTIAFGFVVEYGIVEWERLTGGQNGLTNIPYPAFGASSLGERGIALIAILLMALVLALYKRLARSAWGLAMRAVRDSEIAASAMAINPLVVRTVAFTISAVLAGVAGSLFASATTFIAPSSFPFFQSILFVLVVIVGGVERTYGPVIGAVIVVGIPELLSGLAEYRVLLSGALMLAVLLFAPGGIASALSLGRKRAPADDPAAPVSAQLLVAKAGRRETLEIDSLGIAFGGVRAVNDFSLRMQSGEVTSIIGPNGAGKTTALNIICGFYRPNSGSVRLGAHELGGRPTHTIARAGIARTFQTPQLFDRMTVLENLLVAMQRGQLGGLLSDAPSASTGAQAQTARALLDYVGYRGSVSRMAGNLPHIDRRLLEIARALALRPAILMLDEPAAGLNASDKVLLAKLLRRIADTGVGVVLIEHDMSLVMGISDQVAVLDAGRCIATGTPDAVRNDRTVIAAYLGGATFDAHPRAIDSRPATTEALAVRKLSAGYDGVPVVHDVDLNVRTGEIVAVLGANGAGKSTLMRALAGLLRPVSGSVLLAGVEITKCTAHHVAAQGLALVPEGRQVFPELSVVDNVRLGAYRRRDVTDAEIDAMVRRFPALERRRTGRAGLLSGGEQQMLAIARGLIAKPKVLLLDEPSLGLAPAMIADLYHVVAELRDQGLTILLVDQMAALALAAADRGYVMESGSVVHHGVAGELREDRALERAYLGTA